MLEKPLKILLTGEHDESAVLPEVNQRSQQKLEWIQLPVLQFERLSVPDERMDRVIQKPFDWILFTSKRSVTFWSEALLEKGCDFPLETQVACVGEQTAAAAAQDGFNADFYPTEPGTEVFLLEFEDLISNNSQKPSVFIPGAEGARTTIRDRLRELGCEVEMLSLYRTLPRQDLQRSITHAELAAVEVICFTSPSSVDAFTQAFDVPARAAILAIGRYTAQHLKHKGFDDHRVLPGGDLSRIGEVL